jgi:hypothetical protein
MSGRGRHPPDCDHSLFSDLGDPPGAGPPRDCGAHLPSSPELGVGHHAAARWAFGPVADPSGTSRRLVGRYLWPHHRERSCSPSRRRCFSSFSPVGLFPVIRLGSLLLLGLAKRGNINHVLRPSSGQFGGNQIAAGNNRRSETALRVNFAVVPELTVCDTRAGKATGETRSLSDKPT